MVIVELTAITLGDVCVSGEGANSAPCTSNGQPVIANFEAAQIAFEPSAFNAPAAARINIIFRPTSDVIDTLAQLDEWIVASVVKDSVKYFGDPRVL